MIVVDAVKLLAPGAFGQAAAEFAEDLYSGALSNFVTISLEVKHRSKNATTAQLAKLEGAEGALDFGGGFIQAVDELAEESTSDSRDKSEEAKNLEACVLLLAR